jgi:hypothetical protein
VTKRLERQTDTLKQEIARKEQLRITERAPGQLISANPDNPWTKFVWKIEQGCERWSMDEL